MEVGMTIKVQNTAPERVTVAGTHARSGETVRVRLPVPGVDEAYHPYVTLVGGRAEGPVVSVVAGVHGAEISSIEAARRLAITLGPRLRRGTVIVLPVTNLASFFARSLYVNPVDQKNLNRVFPGSPDGTASERLAHAVVEHLVKPADVVFDLHGGDVVEALDPFMLAETLPGEPANRTALALADLFGLDQVVADHVGGSLAAVATELGKAALLAESGQQGVLSEVAVERLGGGVENVLRSLDMLDGPAPAHAPGHPVFRPSWTWMSSQHTGFWHPAVAVGVGREVSEGALLGTIQPLDLDLPAIEVRSPHAGRIIFLVTALSTTPGTPICAVARQAEPWPEGV
jgi:uncharacterized protein